MVQGFSKVRSTQRIAKRERNTTCLHENRMGMWGWSYSDWGETVGIVSKNMMKLIEQDRKTRNGNDKSQWFKKKRKTENRKQKKSEPAMTKESAYVWRCRREMIGMEDNARWETQESNNLRPTNRYGRIRLPNKYESENKAMERGTRGKSRD